MVEPNLIGGLIGGVLIGAAAALMLLVTGRIAGVSGIVGGLVVPSEAGDRLWRLAFVAGLVAGTGVYGIVRGEFPIELQAQGAVLVAAGLLVGIGTRIGSGCTSGHGVCGLARRSGRSLTATVTFIVVAMVTVFLIRHVLQ